MKNIFYIIISIGAILILLAALFKEMHWAGKKELTIAGVCVLLFAMLLNIYSLLVKKIKN